MVVIYGSRRAYVVDIGSAEETEGNVYMIQLLLM